MNEVIHEQIPQQHKTLVVSFYRNLGLLLQIALGCNDE